MGFGAGVGPVGVSHRGNVRVGGHLGPFFASVPAGGCSGCFTFIIGLLMAALVAPSMTVLLVLLGLARHPRVTAVLVAAGVLVRWRTTWWRPVWGLVCLPYSIWPTWWTIILGYGVLGSLLSLMMISPFLAPASAGGSEETASAA